MKLSVYAVAVAGASIFGQTIAAPVEAEGNVVEHVEKREIERREWTEEEKEALKYFHEPGYVRPCLKATLRTAPITSSVHQYYRALTDSFSGGAMSWATTTAAISRAS